MTDGSVNSGKDAGMVVNSVFGSDGWLAVLTFDPSVGRSGSFFRESVWMLTVRAMMRSAHKIPAVLVDLFLPPLLIMIPP